MAKKKKKFTGYYPATETPYDASASNVDIHNQMSKFSQNVGSETKVRDEKITIRDTATGKTYGTKTLAGKATNEGYDLLRSVVVAEAVADIDPEPLTKDEVEQMLTDAQVRDIKNNVRKGAKDLAQNWKGAIQLAQKAYEVAGIERLTLAQRAAWKQYETIVQYAVQQLKVNRGLDGKWRLTKLVMTDKS